VPDSLQRAYIGTGSQVLSENGERLFRRGWLLDDNGKRRAAGTLPRRFSTVVVCPLCLAVAASLLRQQIHRSAAAEVPDGRGRLLAWQARKVREYIDSHITAGPILVTDLCALVQRSEAHFARSFRRTFGASPRAFVVRRRVELAAQYMLTTDGALSEIALRCGFTDQAHLCKHFRQVTGETPAAWRRAHRSHHAGNGTAIRILRPTAQLTRVRTRLTQSPAFSPESSLRTGS
jgi:AraC family transcriptional regulator